MMRMMMGHDDDDDDDHDDNEGGGLTGSDSYCPNDGVVHPIEHLPFRLAYLVPDGTTSDTNGRLQSLSICDCRAWHASHRSSNILSSINSDKRSGSVGEFTVVVCAFPALPNARLSTGLVLFPSGNFAGDAVDPIVSDGNGYGMGGFLGLLSSPAFPSTASPALASPAFPSTASPAFPSTASPASLDLKPSAAIFVALTIEDITTSFSVMHITTSMAAMNIVTKHNLRISAICHRFGLIRHHFST